MKPFFCPRYKKYAYKRRHPSLFCLSRVPPFRLSHKCNLLVDVIKKKEGGEKKMQKKKNREKRERERYEEDDVKKRKKYMLKPSGLTEDIYRSSPA